MKRFYQKVAVSEGSAPYTILLDDRAVKTPDKRVMQIPSLALAQAVAAEWEEQQGTISLAQMPLTRLASGLGAMTPDLREKFCAECLAYAETDLLCYFAEEPRLREEQAALWEPLLIAAEQALSARFVRASGIIPVPQPEDSLQAVARAMATWSDAKCLAYAELTALTGSALLVMAYEYGNADIECVIAAAQLDEVFQARQWQEDEQAVKQREAKAEAMRGLAYFLALCEAP